MNKQELLDRLEEYEREIIRLRVKVLDMKEEETLMDKLNHHVNWKAYPKRTVEKHFREALKEFLNWLAGMNRDEAMKKGMKKAKEIFGEELVE